MKKHWQLTAAGIEYEVIPGVSSAYSALGLCGHHHPPGKKHRLFHVITGHEDPDKEKFAGL